MLKLIEIELFSYCNRKCGFCPNSLDSFRQNKKASEFLDFKIYKKFVQQLKGINYNGTISYSRYNEPLAFKEITLQYVDYARKMLDCKIVSNTNGDFLDVTSVEIFDELTIMDYNGKGSDRWITKLTKLGCVLQSNDEEFLKFVTPSGKVVLVFLDFKKNATIEDRGGVIKVENMKLKNNGAKRVRPCFEPNYFLGIDYNGSAVVCCNMQSAFHQDYTIGNIYRDTIDTILESPVRQNIIKLVNSSDYSNFPSPCVNCQKDPGRYTRDNPGIDYTCERK